MHPLASTIERDGIYTINEAADLLKIHPRSVWRWLKDGDLNGARIGRFWRISGEDLLEYIQRQTDRARGGAT